MAATSLTASAASSPLVVRYGSRLRLCARSAYVELKGDEADQPPLVGIGFYEKNGRHGILNAVPPLGPKLDHLFSEDEYLVLDPSNQHEPGSIVEYGHTLVLVNQHGMVWNNKTGGFTGYIGPRPRNISGEMYVSFRKNSGLTGGHEANDTMEHGTEEASQSQSASTDSSPNKPKPRGSAILSSSSSSSGGPTSSGTAGGMSLYQMAMESQGPVCFGDENVVVEVVESNRHSQMYNKRLSNFKKSTSRIAGGYICCDGKGSVLKFTICPVKPHVEQISMMRKLIASYHYGQRIALPLSLLEKSEKSCSGGAEIVFKLSNKSTAVLPGKLLHEKLPAHAIGDDEVVEEPKKKSLRSPKSSSKSPRKSRSSDDASDSANEVESQFILPLRNGPGELIVKLIGSLPKCALQRLEYASHGAGFNRRHGTANGSARHAKSVFQQLIRVFRVVPVPFFALFYAFLVRLLWKFVATPEEETEQVITVMTHFKKELAQLVLLLIPAFYAAVKFDHPFSALLNGTSSEADMPPTGPVPSGNLKLVVVDYRFTGGSSVQPSDAHDDDETKAPAGNDSPAAQEVSVDTSGLPRRFLNAEKGDAVKGMARYKETMAWREERQLDGILTRPHPNFKTIKKYYPAYYYKRGLENEPVYYERPGRIDLDNLKRAGMKMDDLLDNFLLITEYLWQVQEPDDNAKCISVIDVNGIGFSDFAGEAVDYVRKASALSGKHYPERCAYIFVINVPSWFNMIWSTVKGFLDEVTREKVTIVRGKKKIFEALSKRIAPENIPPEYRLDDKGEPLEKVRNDPEACLTPRSEEDQLLFDIVSYLNGDEDAPAVNPLANRRLNNHNYNMNLDNKASKQVPVVDPPGSSSDKTSS